MIPLPMVPITHYLEELDFLTKVEIPGEYSLKKRFFSKGQINLYEGAKLNKLATLSVKGLHLYHYDFGIAYPEGGYDYPLFFYQVIIVPKRVLALVHYPYHSLDKFQSIAGIQGLLEGDLSHSELLLTSFQPQGFLQEDLHKNHFNGLIRTTGIDEAYRAITSLFDLWYKGLIQQEKTTDPGVQATQEQWLRDFTNKFYQQDYGFTATKRYMGFEWSKAVFDRYLSL